MKVWILNQNAYTPYQSAGTRHYCLACELMRLGHEPLIITTSFYHKAHKETRLFAGEMWQREVIDQVPFHWLRTPPYRGNSPRRLLNWLVFAWRVWNEVGFENDGRPDVIIGSSPPPFGAWAGQLLSKRYAVPFVYEVRDIWPRTLIDSGGISPLNPLALLMAMLERSAYRNASAVVSLLPMALDHMRPLGLNPSRFHYIPNGVSETEWQRPRQPLPTKHQEVFESCRSEKKIAVVYVGAQGSVQALDQVLDLATFVRHEQRPYRYILIGDGTSHEKLSARIQRDNLHMVSLLPRISKDQARTALEQSDVCFYSLRPDPVFQFGISSNKLFDYMMAGRPVIFAADAGNNPVAEAGSGITVQPYSPMALDEATLELASMAPDERQKIGLRGKRYVMEHHNWRVFGEKYAQILESIHC